MFDEIGAALGLPLLIVGLALLLLPFLPSHAVLVRVLLFGGAILLGWRYMAWRFRETIPPPGLDLDALVGWSFALLEALTLLSASLAFAILTRTRNRSPEVDAHLGWWGQAPAPMVDVLIATYNEEAAILERTIAGAMAIDHPRKRIWVLDDGRREWLRELSERLGARYLTRPDNAHAKAGNINHALAVLRGLPEPPDFIAVLDADFVPHRDFLTRGLALFHDEKVGLVQTPQHFFNPDPIQHNLGLGRAYPDEQRFFFDHVQPARDAWGIAFCCGTSSIMRWTALERIGGFPVDSVTEDYLLTLRLQEEGFSTVYLNEPLSEGLAPEGVGEYVSQRARWCLGLMQIVRSRLGPFSRNRLRLRDRIGLIDSCLFWVATYPFRIACLLVPLAYWFFGITVVDASVPEVIAYFLPYYLAMLIALNWITGGLIVPVLNDVSTLLGAKEITRAGLIGLIRPKGHKFRVTAKGGNRKRVVVQWPLMWPLLIVFLLTVAGLLFSPITGITFDRDAGEGKWVVLAWSVYNLVVLAAAMAVCIELPRAGLGARFEPERTRMEGLGLSGPAWIMRLTLEDAWVRGGPRLPVGAPVTIQVVGVGVLRGVVIRVELGGCAVRFSEMDPPLRARLLARLHTASRAPGVTRTSLEGVLRGLLRRVERANSTR
ncbi:MAG: glycosyltransferase [Rhodovarius sp.]|nr:glycosyltransferase [Rhodovarius sp.]